MITIAIRRVNLGQHSNEPNMLEVISPEKYTILPNTADCYNAEDAIRTCHLAGRMDRKLYASASSPIDGTFF